ncbi:EamA family transporter RarD [Fulvimarina endophytica]|uniref:EamA family transporter RarD n=1 Tax=Fulvimarina endophytica TaxID=2293836 RepID=A0A371XBE1_9HYPH|nr:EamA family transporter RarD [Fulvimarina endophytica]RFC66548.1 EamA family transporter RarD [Fulvimarina endophytica]
MQPDPTETRRGLLLAISAYGLWGIVLPFYMKALDHVSPVEIVAHRIIWALPFAAILLMYQGRFARTVRYLADMRTTALALLTAALISINWGVYVYAIVAGQTVDAALGYYINPLLNVLLAALVLKERPSRLQAIAVGLATVGVAIMTVKAGGLPWISLVLACTFGSYGLVRKMVKVDASEGFFLEVVLLTPFAVAALFIVPVSHFGVIPYETVMLMGAGPLTAVPLILFAAGARLLNFATVGILQYLVPTCLFLIAVFIFGEPFSVWQLVAFAFIWTALGLYTVTLLRQARVERQRRRRRQPSAAQTSAQMDGQAAALDQPPSDQAIR